MLNCLTMKGDLPKYVYRQTLKGHTYYRFRRDGFQIRLPPIGSPDFAETYARLMDDGGARRQTAIQQGIDRYLVGDALPRAKKRAAEYGLPFDLTPELMSGMIEAQGYKCAVSGIPFDLGRSGERRATTRLPFRPSIDRIVPTKGYVAGNVRILCFAVNMAIADWGDDVFSEVCRAVTNAPRSGLT